MDHLEELWSVARRNEKPAPDHPERVVGTSWGGKRGAQSSNSLITTLSTPSISASFTPMTSRRDVGTFLPT